MKKVVYSFAVALAACALAFCVGCSSGAASGSASGGSGASASSAAEGASAENASSPAAAIDPSNLADGEYQVAVTLTGGSGKATVESPAKLIVEDGAMTAVIVWSSPNYDLMVVDGQDYLPVPRDGNSTFEVPVSAFDQELPIQAETTAMSEPHLIDYTLTFDSSSLQ